MTGSTLSQQSSAPASDSGHEELVLVLDFGSQTAQLIARRVRDQNVFCQIVRHDLSADRIRELNPQGLILSGGPASVYGEGAPGIDAGIFELGIPVLGICYGQQAMMQALGGSVAPSDEREFGRAEVSVQAASPLFDGVWQQGHDYLVWMSHGDRVTALAPGFEVIGTSGNAPFAAVANERAKQYGVQFHPEAILTEHGHQLLANFLAA